MFRILFSFCCLLSFSPLFSFLEEAAAENGITRENCALKVREVVALMGDKPMESAEREMGAMVYGRMFAPYRVPRVFCSGLHWLFDCGMTLGPLCFSPDGTKLITGKIDVSTRTDPEKGNEVIEYYYDPSVRIWDFVNSRQTTLSEWRYASYSAIYDFYQSVACVWVGGVLRLVSLSAPDKLVVRNLDRPYAESSIEISASRNAIASIAAHPTLPIVVLGYRESWRFTLVNVETKTHKTCSAHGAVEKIVFSPDGSTLAALGGRQLDIYRFDAAELRLTVCKTFGLPESPSVLRFSPDGAQLLLTNIRQSCLSPGGGRIVVLNYSTAEYKQYSLEASEKRFVAAELNQVDGTLMTATQSGRIEIWDRAGVRLKRLNLDEEIDSAYLTCFGDSLIVVANNRIKIIDFNGNRLAVYQPHPVEDLTNSFHRTVLAYPRAPLFFVGNCSTSDTVYDYSFLYWSPIQQIFVCWAKHYSDHMGCVDFMNFTEIKRQELFAVFDLFTPLVKKELKKRFKIYLGTDDPDRRSSRCEIM